MNVFQTLFDSVISTTSEKVRQITYVIQNFHVVVVSLTVLFRVANCKM